MLIEYLKELFIWLYKIEMLQYVAFNLILIILENFKQVELN